MANPITITIKGSGTDGRDAPTVDDLLLQIQDIAAILKTVDSAISRDDKQNIVWRVTNVTKNSPLAFELTAFPVNPHMNIEAPAVDIVGVTSHGLTLVQSKSECPKFFNDKILNHTKKLFKRVANGLAETTIDFGKTAKPVTLARRDAEKTIEHIHALQKPKDMPYRELGSVEGTITRIERDGFGRSLVWLKTRLDGQTVKCLATGKAANRIGHVELSRVWEGLRVRITGVLAYKGLGKLQDITADNVRFFECDDKLPSVDDILDRDFAKGFESVAYLKKIRGEYE